MGDDLDIHTWDVEGIHKEKLISLDVSPIDFDWLKQTGKGTDLMAIGCSDGSFLLSSGGRRVDSKINEAHEGAVVSIRWSYDGGDLATAGEDGQIKLWSKQGAHRSTLVKGSSTIYCICWSPDHQILYC